MMSEMLSQFIKYLANVRSFALRPKSTLFFQPLLGLRPKPFRRLGVDAHRDLNCV
jgi:hypothetical protein